MNNWRNGQKLGLTNRRECFIIRMWLHFYRALACHFVNKGTRRVTGSAFHTENAHLSRALIMSRFLYAPSIQTLCCPHPAVKQMQSAIPHWPAPLLHYLVVACEEEMSPHANFHEDIVLLPLSRLTPVKKST